MDIKPSEHNDVNNFKHHFTKTKNPMHGPKYLPAIVVAKQKMYVMSKYPTDTLFEVYSPVDETWQVLPIPNDAPFGRGLSVVSQQKQTCYFIASDTLLSFNLQTHEWTLPPDFFQHNSYADCCDASYIYPPPPSEFLDKCVSLIGGMAFGYVYDHDAKSYYVSASRTFTSAEDFMKPNLAPDRDFLEALRTSRFAYMSQH
ncbi:hypothetical protein AgCh_002276 [Apium graveolens]